MKPARTPDDASAHGLFTFFTALAADAEQCEWESDEYFFWGECHRSVMEISKHPQQYMAYCYGCGKRIKFKESEE